MIDCDSCADDHSDPTEGADGDLVVTGGGGAIQGGLTARHQHGVADDGLRQMRRGTGIIADTESQVGDRVIAVDEPEHPRVRSHTNPSGRVLLAAVAAHPEEDIFPRGYGRLPRGLARPARRGRGVRVVTAGSSSVAAVDSSAPTARRVGTSSGSKSAASRSSIESVRRAAAGSAAGLTVSGSGASITVSASECRDRDRWAWIRSSAPTVTSSATGVGRPDGRAVGGVANDTTDPDPLSGRSGRRR